MCLGECVTTGVLFVQNLFREQRAQSSFRLSHKNEAGVVVSEVIMRESSVVLDDVCGQHYTAGLELVHVGSVGVSFQF